MDKILKDKELKKKMAQRAPLKAREYGEITVPY